MFGNNHDATDDGIDNEQTTYGFIDEPDVTDEGTTLEPDSEGIRRWTLGDHSVDTGLDSQELDDAIQNVREVNNDLASVLEEARDMVETTDVSGFECPVCGLNHSHADTKHDIRADDRTGFNVSAEFADEMEYNPYCHCGVNELAMLMDFFHYITIPIFDHQHEFESVLEIPPEVVDEVHREMKDSRQDPDRDTLDVEGAIKATDNEYDVPPEAVDELGEFLNLKEEIAGAADSAPIAGETREAIEEARTELEAAVAQ